MEGWSNRVSHHVIHGVAAYSITPIFLHMAIAEKLEVSLGRSSWIRKMFEEGARLKGEHGADKVFDFTLGNPNLEPPEEFQHALLAVVQDERPGMHGYMPNAGYPSVREIIAQHVNQAHQLQLSEQEIVMTCGAAGALNVVLKTLLNPGDEVLCPTPYFVEYGFYADNHGGVLRTASTTPDFQLDLDAIAEALTPKTKVVLINSPNNPTGQVYSPEHIQALGDLLREFSQKHNREIYLVSDEPYRKIVFDDIEVPHIMHYYENSLVLTSYSKDLSLPGERIGFLAVNPAIAGKDLLMSGLIMSNRILGFVNAPALMQRVVAKLQASSVDVDAYQRKRDLLCDGLADCGYAVTKPAGAFYLFLKAPIADDVEFVQALQEELILAVPGKGFGGPGHIRLAYCVDDQTITNAMPGFRRVLEKYQTRNA
jgi:aspartate aminotransferase